MVQDYQKYKYLFPVLFSVLTVLLVVFYFFRPIFEQYFMLPIYEFSSRRVIYSNNNYAYQKKYANKRLESEINELKNENKLLKEQLGYIPQKADLITARFLWSYDTEALYLVESSNKRALVKKGVLAIVNNKLIGWVDRVGSRFIIIRPIIHSQFNSKAVTQRGIQGAIKGRFGQKIVFLYPVEQNVNRGDEVYAVDDKRGWRFYIGTIESLEKQQSQPQRRAVVKYEYDSIFPQIVFLAL